MVALYIPIKIKNLFTDMVFPESGVVYGYIDTGYTGFLVIPTDVYNNLELNKLKQFRYILRLANGEAIETKGAYGQIIFAETGFEEEGIIETSNTIKEIIIGIKALKNYKTILNFCRNTSQLEICIG